MATSGFAAATAVAELWIVSAGRAIYAFYFKGGHPSRFDCARQAQIAYDCGGGTAPLAEQCLHHFADAHVDAADRESNAHGGKCCQRESREDRQRREAMQGADYNFSR